MRLRSGFYVPLARTALAVVLLLALSGCAGVLSLRMPEDYKNTKIQEDAPPGDAQAAPQPVP